MDKQMKQIAEEIMKEYHNEFSLLRNRYSDLNWRELNTLVENDLWYMKEYQNCTDCINRGKVDTFVEFLEEFQFYVHGKGTTWPANFPHITYCEEGTGKHLGDEMKKTLVAALEKENNGQEADV